MTGPVVVPRDTSGGEARIQQVRTAPITTTPSAMLPVGLAEALIGRDPGKFAGDAASWPTWRKRWQQYFNEVLDMYPAISHRQRLTLLIRWMDEPSALLLQEELERDPTLSYDKVWARLDLSFGAAGKEQLRRQLKAVKLQTRGKVVEKEWSEVFARITTIAGQLGDVSEAETARLLLDTLPPNPWRRKLAEEEEKKQLRGGLAVEGMPQDTTSEELMLLMEEETGARPKTVRRHHGKWRIQPVDEEHRTVIKRLFDRQALQGGAVISVAPDSVELTPAEINELMLRWIRIDQRVSYGTDTTAADTTPDKRKEQRHQGPPGRYHREVQAEEEQWQEDQWAEDCGGAIWEVTKADAEASSSSGGDGKGKGKGELWGGRGKDGGGDGKGKGKGKGKGDKGGKGKGGWESGKGKGWSGKGGWKGDGKGATEWSEGGKGKGEQQE